MEDQRHFIQKQKLIFDFPTEEKANSWNRNASSFYYSEIVPLLNQLFNKCIPIDRLYSIDSLEIDLGKIHQHEIKEALLKKLEAKLNNILTEEKNGDLLRLIEKKPNNLGLRNTVILRKKEEKLLEVFYTFLDYGILTWNSNFDANSQLEDAVLKQIGIDKLIQHRDFKDRIKQPWTRKRFFHQFSKPFIEQVFQRLLPEELEVIELFKSLMSERIKASSFDVQSKNIIRQIISHETLTWIIASDSDETEDLAKDVIHSAITKIERQLSAIDKGAVAQSILFNLLSIEKENKFSHSLNQLIKIVELHPTYERIVEIGASAKHAIHKTSLREGNEGAEKNKEFFTREKPPIQNPPKLVSDDQVQHQSLSQTNVGSREENIKSNEWGSASTTSAGEDLERARVEESKTQETVKFENKVSVRPDIARRKKEIIKDRLESLTEYYVVHAGIVLCWPYLARLFERLGYLLSDDFRSQESQERAVHVLGYIASGHDNCEEHELTLAKLLTGWPLQMPLVKEMKLLKKEKRESDKMLHSLILNWPILQNTSIEGLRSSFFQRDGKLIKEDEGWRLIVEQKSYDMLLDHMHYSIAIIKLPWSTEILKVDWA